MAILNHGSTLRTADGGQTTTTIVTAANIGTYGVATNATYYVGTTQNVFNRASGAQTLTGVSIDGNAATVTNGLTTGNYNSYALPLAGGTLTGNLTITKASAYLYLNGTNSDAELRFLANSSDRWAMGMNVGDATENLNIYNYTTATTNFTILKASGNVGVGTASPSYKLDVSGAINASTYVYAGVFYDNDNTAYYTNPTGTSNLNAITLNSSGSGGYLTLPGSITVSNVSGAEMVIRGLSQLRFSNSTSWDWNAWAGLRYDNAGTTIYLGGPAATTVFTANTSPPTVTVSFVGTNNVTSDSNFKAPIFYDSANTAYYVDAASTSVLNALTVGGNNVLTTSSTLTAGNLSGTIPSAVLGNSTHYIGTTAITLNRGSASQTLTGVSIDGNAATATNGLTTSNYVSYSAFTGAISSGGAITATSYIYTSTYLQTGGNLIYPSGYGSTQRLEVGNSANNNWIDGLTIAPGGTVTAPDNMRSPIFYDSNDTAYYCDPASTSRLNTLQATRINFGATGATPYAAASGEGIGNGITFGGDEAGNGYRIFTAIENIGGNYSKLTFNWHTGVRIGAAYQYGGTRFYNNSVGVGTEIFSVGNLDNNVRVVNSLIANGITINQERANNARMYGAATGAFGLLGLDSAGSFRWQLYGEGSNYGFLDSTWGGWDINKVVNGQLDIRVSGGLVRVLNAGNYVGYSAFTSSLTSTVDARAPIFYDSNDTAYYVDPASNSRLLNLGLGNVTPDLRLSVSGDAQLSGILYLGGTAGSYNSWGSRTYTTSGVLYNNSSSVEFNNYGYGSTWTFTLGGGNATSSGAFRAPVFYDSDNTAYYLDAANSTTSLLVAGKVGIGTTSPRVLLDLAKANNVAQVLLLGETGANIRVGFGLNPSNAGMRIFSYNHISDGLIEFGGISSDGSTWTRNHRLGLAGGNSFFNEQGGNVGIGTTSPGYKLDVNGTFRTATNNLTIFNDYLYVSPTENNTFNSAYSTNGIADMWINYAGYNNGNTQFRNLNIGNGKNGVIAWFDGTNKRMSINNNQAASYPLHVVGTAYSDTDFRAPIFYDSNDTTYYIDPASTSRVVALWVRGSSETTGNIYIGGTSAGNRLNINYDQIWTSTGHLYLQYSGAGNIDMNTGGGHAFSRTSLRAPIFYDFDNTAYYIDAASTSNVNNLTAAGTITVTNIAKNSTSPIVINSGSSASLGLRVYYDMNLYNTLVFTDSAWNSQGRIFGSSSVVTIQAATTTTSFVKYAGYSEEGGSFRAPIFYDSNNTAYYLDPANTNSLYYIVMPHIGNGSPNLVVNNGASENWNAIKINGGNDNNGIGFSNTSHSAFARNNLSFHTHNLDSIRFHSSGWDTLFEVAGSSGNAWLKGGSFDSSFTRLLNPGGAYYVTGTSTITGAIKIRLPRLNANTMMRMTVKIYQYNTGQSATIECGGYDYSGDGVWRNIFAYQNSDLFATVNVRFGNDGTYDCVWIGETSSTWSYPQVFVTDFQAGYNNYTSDWGTGWNISYVTAFNTVTDTRVAYKTLNASNYNSYSPTLTGTGASGTWAISVTGNAATVTNGVYTTGDQTISGIKYFTSTVDPSTVPAGYAGGYLYESTTGFGTYGIIFGSATGQHGAIGYSSNTMYFGTENGTDNTLNTKATLSSGGTFTANGDARAPIFYDSANTAYYVDPAGTSNLNALVLSGASYFRPQTWIQMDASYGMYWPNTNGCHIEGNTLSTYGSLAIRGTRSGWKGIHFYEGGNVPHLMFDGSANGGVYFETGGRWASYYSYGNNCWGFGTSTTNSAYNLYLGTGIYSGGRVDGTIFYDSNNTAYYVDPASTSNLNIVTVNDVLTYGVVAAKSFSVSVNTSTYWTVVRPNGSSIATGYVYRITLCTTGTGTDTGEQYLLANVDSAGWVIKTVTKTGSGSNWPYVFLDSGVPKVKTDHPSLYTVTVLVEELNSGNTGGLPSVFGLAGLFTSDNGTPKYRAGWFSSDNTLLHSGNYSGYSAFTSSLTSTVDARAPIFYDSNDTAYYVDPNSTSNLVGLTVANTITGSITGNAGGSSASCTGNAATASNATQFGSEANTNFMRGLAGGTQANLDTYTDNGFRSIAYTGYSRNLLSFNPGGSTGTVQHEYYYNIPSSGWRVRNKTDNTTWSAWGNVVMTDTNQGALTGTIITTNSNTTVSGLNIGGNAVTVGGLSVHSGRNNEVNKVVRTDGNGYIQAGWINTDSGDSGFATRLTRITCSTDNYLRYLGLIDFKVSIGGSGKNNYSRRVDYTSDVNYHVGSFGHNGYGANETFHGGSGFIDIWDGTNYPSGLSHIHGFNALHYTVNSLGTTGGAAYGWQMVAQYNSDSGPWWRRCSGGSFSSWLRLVSYGNNQSGTIYASDFYDNDNTAYYINPASTSNLLGLTVVNTITGSITGNAGGSSASCTGNSATTTLATKATRANGNFYIDDNYGNTVVGVYSATRLQGVFAMGDSYKLTADGTGVGTLYGLAWSHPNFGGVAANLADHGLLILQNGVFKGAWGGGSLRTPGDVRGTLFYDWDNTGYYCDPASTSNLNAITAAGSVTAANYYTGGWFRNNASGNGLYNEATGQHFYSDSTNYWNVASSASAQGIRLRTGGHAGTVRGYFYADTNNDVGFLNQDGSWRLRVVGGDYSLADGSSMRAQLFYDSNNTGYYVDPASTSNLAGLTVANTISGSITGSAGSVAWTNVSGRPTAVSSFSNDSGYITSGGSISGSSGSCTGNAASVTDGVYLSTNQSISGVKTFSSAPVATNIAKAWVHYNMNNNTINASYNVSSVTDNGTGVCTVNFSTSMVDANYVVAGTATYGYDDQDIYAMILAVPRRSTAQQAGSCRLATEFIHAAQVYDCVAVRAVFYR